MKTNGDEEIPQRMWNNNSYILCRHPWSPLNRHHVTGLVVIIDCGTYSFTMWVNGFVLPPYVFVSR